MNKSTPRDVFIHLLAVVMLIVSVVSVIGLAFQFINVYFPDAIDFYSSRRTVGSSVQGFIAALVISWPVYLYLILLLGRDVAVDPEKREIRVRKWLFNLTLFIAAITIIIDLISLIRNFLGGELTARFGLKVLTVLVVAGVVFAYYLWDLKRDVGSPNKVAKPLGILTSAVIIAGIIGSFFLGGTPATQRAWRFDEQRVYDLERIQIYVMNHWEAKGALPKGLSELTDSVSGFVAPVDPEGTPYEYAVTGDHKFDLCATFATDSPDQLPKTPAPMRNVDFKWDHAAGRTCFSRTIDPALYRQRGLGVGEQLDNLR